MTLRLHDTLLQTAQPSVVPSSRVRCIDEVAQVGVPHSTEHAPAKVELVKDGDIVQAIDVTCGCGQHIRVWCIYE